MKKRIGIILMATLGSVGCTNKQISEYAKQLADLLNTYQEGLTSRIDAERALYNELAEQFAVEAERDVYENLKLARQLRARLTTTALSDERTASTQIYEHLRDAAIGEFDRTRAYFEQEMTVAEGYQRKLAKLKLDAAKVDALAEALVDLQKEADLRTTLGDLGGSAADFKKEFKLQGCKDLKRKLAIRTESIADLAGNSASTELAANLTASKATLETQIKAQKCE